ncbi:MAG: ABC transporter ATP-binding protein [Lachnospiraceae bacterium]|nr:ABC transporter ATP-binding protein [Lachnospiraceae bacterium]
MELELKNLTKDYGSKRAVDNISISFGSGVYGLLGPNGAGKTTLMRMICGVLNPTSGEILLDGENMNKLGEFYYSNLGYMPQNFGFYPDFTAREFLLYMAAVKGLDGKTAKERTDMLLEMVNLAELADSKIKSFSGGMKQRLGIAQAELNSPSILILDEPTAGLDPKERVRFRNLISELARNKTVILSTHIVSDISYIADRILMLKKGQILLDCPMNRSTDVLQGKVWEVLTDERTAYLYQKDHYVLNIHHEDSKVRLRIISDEKPMENAVLVAPGPEDLYMYYFGEEITG